MVTSLRPVRPTCERVSCEVSDHVREGGRVHGRWQSMLALACLLALSGAGAGAWSAYGQAAQNASLNAAAEKSSSAPGKMPVYDVVTIRPNDTGPGHVDIDRDTNT